MLTETLDKLIQEEIEKGIEQFKQDHVKLKKDLIEYKNKYQLAFKQTNDLQKLEKEMSEFKSFKELINEENIKEVVSHLKLKKVNIDFSGMNSEHIPVWFKLVCTYYLDKQRLFMLLDMFNIKYPDWAKSFKIPFDYDEKELDLIFENLGRMYVCNGQIFNGNMGFFYAYQNSYKGNLEKLFNEDSYAEIPWNLLLGNPLLTTEKYFSKILNVLEDKRLHSDYFFMIQDYQGLTQKQVEAMAAFLPVTNINDYHRNFLNKNKEIFKIRKDLAFLHKGKITANRYSVFNYLNYPEEMQKEFVLNMAKKNNKFDIDLVQNMKIKSEEKIRLLSEIAKLIVLDKEC